MNQQRDNHNDEKPEPELPAGSAVQVTPEVVTTIVQQETLAVAGVARMGRVPNRGLWQRNAAMRGVQVRVSGRSVAVTLYVVISQGSHMVHVGDVIKQRVTAALEHMVGLTVSELNIYIQDIE